MGVQKAPYWTDLYYHMVEHYFWRPQAIGRISHPTKPARPWAHWKEKLTSQETPLNHIVDFLFHVAPQELLDGVLSALLGRPISGLQLVATTDGTVDKHVVAPDIIVSNGTELVFVEMKVDSQSSIDQFMKYVIASQCIMQDEPQLGSVDLVVLSRHSEHERVWSRARQIGLVDGQAVRAAALRGLRGDASIWGERGVQRYLRAHPDALPDLCERVETMGLQLADYALLDGALCEYAAREPTVGRLIEGVRHEFVRRALIEHPDGARSASVSGYP